MNSLPICCSFGPKVTSSGNVDAEIAISLNTIDMLEEEQVAIFNHMRRYTRVYAEE